jgi:hypothetical protein
MSGKLWLAGGLAAGYVLGTRAGRQRYEQLVETVNKVKNDPAVQGAIETVQNQAGRIYSSGRAIVNDKLETSRVDEDQADLEAELVDAKVSAL